MGRGGRERQGGLHTTMEKSSSQKRGKANHPPPHPKIFSVCNIEAGVRAWE